MDSSPLSILLLVSSPHEAPVSVQEDLAALHDAVRDLDYDVEFVTCVAEPNAVQRVLNRQDRPPFRVLHFIGHGASAHEKMGAQLAFEDRLGSLHLLDGARLAPVLSPTGRPEFELAVLSACHSEQVAQALIKLGVKHVVAIEADAAVYEIAAVRFYEHFYRALFTGASVAQAFRAGRSAVLADDRLGESAQTEAAKFRLLPTEADHHTTTLKAPPTSSPVRIQELPAISSSHFQQPAVGFIGRATEKLEVLRRLDRHRAVLIRGVSGIGKSELAREVGRWLAQRGWIDPQRAYFIPVDQARSAEEVRALLAAALGIPADQLPGDERQANDHLASLIPRRSLLLVDEAENVIQYGGRGVRDLLERLLQAPGRPFLLITSQRDMASPGIPIYPLPRMDEQEAIELFARSAHLDPGAWRRLDREHLAEVLNFVDRVPRAIDLLAKVWRREGDPDFTRLLTQLHQYQDRILRDPDYPDEVKSVTLGVQLGYVRLRERSLDAARLFAELPAA
ncbi:CHAT domain-containing protein [Litorilinea aerophila]|uniref:CHAT domain-containing protein n=1 Tax=Litorilinea aerophila TaxID=1204385 RepID=A0A540VGN7_9CHLR|nr:CHAT domain-containing protein [Litorilinea aerophila]MCC9076308.1 CHAT domain-containing protein [Litorilinea aerophila]OUC05561.1 hypothetical protein RY27_26525 [Litorilinea aerophila]